MLVLVQLVLLVLLVLKVSRRHACARQCSDHGWPDLGSASETGKGEEGRGKERGKERGKRKDRDRDRDRDDSVAG